MSKERFEIFGKIIKDNEEMPNLLDNYLATVRLNEFNEKVKELEQDLEFTTKTANDLIEIKHKLEQELEEFKEKAIVPKFKIGQEVWYISQNNDNVYEFMIKEMVFTRCKDEREMIVYYDEYCAQMYEYELYSSKEEAQAKLQELRGGDFSGE